MVGCFSLSSEHGSGQRWELSWSRRIPRWPLSILSGRKCNPRLTRPLSAPQAPYPGSPSPHSFPHSKQLGLWREMLLDKTWHNLSCACPEISMRKVTGCDSGRNPTNTLMTGLLMLGKENEWERTHETPWTSLVTIAQMFVPLQDLWQPMR